MKAMAGFYLFPFFPKRQKISSPTPFIEEPLAEKEPTDSLQPLKSTPPLNLRQNVKTPGGPKQGRTRLRMLQALSLLSLAAFAYARTDAFSSAGPWRPTPARRLIGFALVGTPDQRSESISVMLRNGSCPTDYHLDTALAVCTALDHHWDVSSIADLEGYVNENGAFSKHNQRYDETGQGNWYIEEQYYGFMFVQAGLAFNNTRAIDLGLRIFDWGFKQQQRNGSFSCPDTYHSSGFFMESVARAALLLRFSAFGRRYNRWITKAEDHLCRLVDWFLNPKIEERGWIMEAPHTHRRYLTGTGIGLVGRLTRNDTLIQISWKYIQSGLAQQDPSGFNRERNGYDCSYQGIGLVYAARYYLYVANTETERAQLLNMGRRGAAWLLGRVQKNGIVNTKGNTRTGLKQENGRNGKPKALAKREMVQALLYWGWITGNEDMVDAAWLVEEERTGSLHRPCNCYLDPEGKWLVKNVLRCEMGLCDKGIRVMSEDRASLAKWYGRPSNA